MAHENIYAICDIDDRRLADTLQQDFAAPFRDKTKTYRDYREMLDSEPEIDAVLISTPDHMHAPIAMHAMGLGNMFMCKSRSAIPLMSVACWPGPLRANNIVTQMGNQGHAGEGARLINEWVASGALGEIRKCTAGPIGPSGLRVSVGLRVKHLSLISGLGSLAGSRIPPTLRSACLSSV